MTGKELVLETVRGLPDSTSLDDISEEIATLAAIARGEAAADDGRVTPHEEVPELLRTWITRSSGPSQP